MDKIKDNVRCAGLLIFTAVLMLTACEQQTGKNGPFLANGIKIGEVTSTDAIIWTRLTVDSVRVPSTAPVPKILYQDDSFGTWHPVDYFKKNYKEDRPDRNVKVVYPEGNNVHTIDGAVPGSPGMVRVSYKRDGDRDWTSTAWQTADSAADYTSQFRLNDLSAGTTYHIKAEAKASDSQTHSDVLTTSFSTAPAANMTQDIVFAVSTCQEYNDRDDGDNGFKIYTAMQSLGLDFYVNAGDILYYDHYAKNLPLARWQWQQMFSLPTLYNFHNAIPSYFMKDDHDTWMNDSYRGKVTRFMGDFTFEQGLKLFLQEVPMNEKTYRTVRWGKDLQVWLMEGRDFRSPNDMPDGPEKTIWGKEQLQWFEETLNESDATFKIVISPTPIVGPDRPQKNDNHANNGFRYEGNVIKQILSKHPNTFIICGDRHWQYVSQDSLTGLLEFSCGAASDQHAGGWNQEDVSPEHKYLNVVGGFLAVNVKHENEIPSIEFTHRNVDGEVLYRMERNSSGK